MRFLVYMYYTHSCYQTSIFGKNCAYYIRIFTVMYSYAAAVGKLQPMGYMCPLRSIYAACKYSCTAVVSLYSTRHSLMKIE